MAQLQTLHNWVSERSVIVFHRTITERRAGLGDGKGGEGGVLNRPGTRGRVNLWQLTELVNSKGRRDQSENLQSRNFVSKCPVDFIFYLDFDLPPKRLAGLIVVNTVKCQSALRATCSAL